MLCFLQVGVCLEEGHKESGLFSWSFTLLLESTDPKLTLELMEKVVTILGKLMRELS